jgi:DNA-binding NarL/FixJ family response regulator
MRATSPHADVNRRPTSKAVRLLTAAQWQRIVAWLRLSEREAQILAGVFEDKKELAIATDLGISPHTVHTHFERMYRKLGVGDRCSLVVRVFEAYLDLKAKSTQHVPAAKHVGVGRDS